MGLGALSNFVEFALPQKLSLRQRATFSSLGSLLPFSATGSNRLYEPFAATRQMMFHSSAQCPHLAPTWKEYRGRGQRLLLRWPAHHETAPDCLKRPGSQKVAICALPPFENTSVTDAAKGSSVASPALLQRL
jgi:hypothetical protein